MLYSLVSDDAFLELCILREKAEAALNCILDDSDCARMQTLAHVASDYLSAMDGKIEAMQESRLKLPPSSA